MTPTIEFTINFLQPSGVLPFSPTDLSGYMAQYSTWMPATAADNVVRSQNGTIILSGLQAMNFKSLVDKGVAPFTYKFVPYPKITKVSPNTDYISGGSLVTLTGSGFAGTTNVRFGDKNAQWFVVNSDTSITTSEFPASSQTVDIIVKNTIDFSNVVQADKFSFISKSINGDSSPNIPLTGAAPGFNCTGPDGNIWVSDSNGKVWKVTTAGVTTSYSVIGSSFLAIVITGPDGNIWIEDANYFASTSNIWKITPEGVITSHPFDGIAFGGVCVGPDGNLWASGFDSNLFAVGMLWKITTNGNITPYILGPDVSPLSICVGPDGNLLIASNTKLLKVSLNGVVVATVADLVDISIFSLCVGSDGNIWSIGANTSYGVIKITPNGDFTFYSIGDEFFGNIIAGPDGNIWTTNFLGHIFKITITGQVTDYTIGNQNIGICVGSDGNLWMADQSGNLIKIV